MRVFFARGWRNSMKPLPLNPVWCHTFGGGIGWSGGVKVSCILYYWGVQLILAYSWARPAILVAGKGRRRMILFLLFLDFHSFFSFFRVPLISSTISSISFLPFSGRWHKYDPKELRVVKLQHNQFKDSQPRWLSWMGRPTGDQEVAGSTPAKIGNILSWRSWNIFYGHSLPSADSRRAVVSFCRKNVHNTG